MLHNEARKLVLEAWDKPHNAREIAKYFTERGYIVFGNDIISHGRSTTSKTESLYFTDWSYVVEDMIRTREYVSRKFPEADIFLLGFSLGSFIVRTADDLSAYKKEILIGTGYQSAFLLHVLRNLIVRKFSGKIVLSQLSCTMLCHR